MLFISGHIYLINFISFVIFVKMDHLKTFIPLHLKKITCNESVCSYGPCSYWVWLRGLWVSQVMLVTKEPLANAGDTRSGCDAWAGKVPWGQCRRHGRSWGSR